MPTRPRALRRIAVLPLCAALLAAACGIGPPDHVRLGMVAPLTGPRAYLGEEMVAGAELAVADLNDAGGLLGRRVELVVSDGTDLVAQPGQLADLAERARVSAVIGPEAPGVLLGPRSPLSRREVPALLPTAFGGDLATAPGTVVRTVPSARAQSTALGRWLADERGADDVVLLVADPVEGLTVRDELLAGFDDAGLEVAGTVTVDAASASLGPAVAALRRQAPDADAALLWGPPPAAARATVAARDQGWDTQLAVGSSAFIAEYRSLAGDASEGVVLPFPFREEWFTEPDLTRWMLRYHARHGIAAIPDLDTLVLDVPVVAAASYDAVQLAAAAVRAADSRVPAAVAAAIGEVAPQGLLRTYEPAGGRAGERWAAGDLSVARFHHLAVTYDVDPDLDPRVQRGFWEAQVGADFVPELLSGDARALVEELLEQQGDSVPAYAPPAPPPGPVARPDRP